MTVSLKCIDLIEAFVRAEGKQRMAFHNCYMHDSKEQCDALIGLSKKTDEAHELLKECSIKILED